MTRKLFILALLASVVAAILVTPATAKPPGTNGLISFTRFDPALGQDIVYTINPDGSHEQQLMVAAESGHWSPDGSRILIGPDCCAEQILNPDTGSYTELPTFYPDLGLFLGCGVWSPDGARLACEGFGDDSSADGVYTVNSLDGGNVRGSPREPTTTAPATTRRTASASSSCAHPSTRERRRSTWSRRTGAPSADHADGN